VGQALPVEVSAFRQTVTITMTLTSGWDVASMDGGITIFAAYSAGGPVVARIPVLPPFVVDLEGGFFPQFSFRVFRRPPTSSPWYPASSPRQPCRHRPGSRSS
jgi:hypothetical protein